MKVNNFYSTVVKLWGETVGIVSKISGNGYMLTLYD